MTLVAFYLLVSLAYYCLSIVAPSVATSAIVGFVAVLLLVPAAYSEWLRIRRR